MAGPHETLGCPWILLPVRACTSLCDSFCLFLPSNFPRSGFYKIFSKTHQTVGDLDDESPSWAYGKGWPWTSQSFTRARHALYFYALRSGRPTAVFYPFRHPTPYAYDRPRHVTSRDIPRFDLCMKEHGHVTHRCTAWGVQRERKQLTGGPPLGWPAHRA
jgi:hypothetical protein